MDIPKEVIAEVAGFALGDGYISKHDYKLTITGGIDDLVYYRLRVIPLIKKHFGGNFGIYKRKDKNGENLEFNNKKLVTCLLEHGLKRGRKLNPQIPSFILEDKNLYSHFLRGLYDTDGSLKFSKQTKKINYYPRITISQKPSKLTNEVSILLTALGFNYSFSICKNDKGFNKKEDSYLGEYIISGKDNLKKWISTVSPKNPVHLSKYYLWCLQGYCKPNTRICERIRMLRDNFIKEDFQKISTNIGHSPVESKSFDLFAESSGQG